MSNSGKALIITGLIALFILWLIFGHTTEHIWSSAIFAICFIVVIVVATRGLHADLQVNHVFDQHLLLPIIPLIIFGLLLNTEISYWGNDSQLWFHILNIIRWVVNSMYMAFFVYTVIRVIQENQS